MLVACAEVRRVKEFSSLGHLLREFALPGDAINRQHAIQTRRGQLIVCYGGPGDRVCTMSADGRRIVHSGGGQPGSDTRDYDVPCHLAVDDDEFVFVTDTERVTLLSPTRSSVPLSVDPILSAFKHTTATTLRRFQ